MTIITYEEFERVNLRSGTIVKVEECPRAKKPAFKVWAYAQAQMVAMEQLKGFT